MQNEEPGIFGGDNREIVTSLKEKLDLTCANSRVREALYYLVNKGLIKRARFNQAPTTIDASNYQTGIIFYLEGVPDEKFSSEFWDFIEKNGQSAILA